MYFGQISRAVVLDPLTIRFDFKVRTREMPFIAGAIPVFSHKWGMKPDGSHIPFDQLAFQKPIASGPYLIEQYDNGRTLTLKRDPAYWGNTLPVRVGTFNFERITYKLYSDGVARLEAFKAGAYNFRQEWDATKWMTGYDFPAIKDGRAIREDIHEAVIDRMQALIFNLRRPLFTDAKVRQALGLALDFEWMNRALFRGSFHRIESYFPNSEFAARGTPSAGELALLEPFREQLPSEVFGPAFVAPQTDGSGDEGLRPNLRKAMALLQQAGWVVRDGKLVNGVTGAPFAFEILLNDPHDERLALPFARALKRLGIDARVKTIDPPQYIQRRSQFDFDMILDLWDQTPSPVTEPSIYWGSRDADAKGSRNYPGIRSQAVDALAASVADAKDRPELLDRMHALDRVMSWGYYTIPLYYLGTYHVAYWRPVCHPKTTPSWGLVFEDWYADPNCETLAP